MADNSSSGAVGILGVLIGALIVIALAYVFLGDRIGLRGPADVNVKIDAPAPK
jgi:hypothetical protein